MNVFKFNRLLVIVLVTLSLNLNGQIKSTNELVSQNTYTFPSSLMDLDLARVGILEDKRFQNKKGVTLKADTNCYFKSSNDNQSL